VRLLIVEDDRALRDAVRRALALSGYEVLTTDTGQGALTQVATTAHDAVVLDIGLPDIDGLEVCRRLRAAGNRVPVLMLTARDAVDDRIDGLDAGADDYVVKPFDLGELKARLRALIRRSVGDGARSRSRSRSSGSTDRGTACASASASSSSPAPSTGCSSCSC
jgi:two-component system, OmpR family, response regulator MprA